MKKGLFPLFLVFLLSGTPACFVPVALVAGGAAGAGGYVWYSGKLTKKFESSVTGVFNASLRALKKMEIPIEKKKKDAFGALIETHLSSSDTRVEISISRLSKGVTEVGIRVGTLGSKEKAEQIMKNIEKSL